MVQHPVCNLTTVTLYIHHKVVDWLREKYDIDPVCPFQLRGSGE